MAQNPLINRFIEVINRPSIWLLIALFLPITFLQYAQLLEQPTFLTGITSNLGLTRYTVERILYLLPIIWASFSFGWIGGAITSLAAVACMLPRALFASPVPEDALVETSAVFIVGILVSYSLASLRKERRHYVELEAARDELQFHLRAIEASEKRLAALNQTSSIISRSLELTQVLDSAVDCVADVMGVDAVQTYILDEEAGELALVAYQGVSERFAKGVDRLRVGEGFNGRVAETGEPLFAEDASEDPRLTKEVIKEENIRSQLIVPLRSKGKVVGTLCVAMRSHRSFLPEEVDLLTAIGNQIGVAVENARLYQYERQIAEQLKASEQRYRELFENAHDAILVHDMNGDILVANKACERLTGYTCQELIGMNVNKFLTTEFLDIARNVRRKLLKGEAFEKPYEQQLVKKDGIVGISMMTTSLVVINGDVKGFQHIVRDVTEERQTHENLHFLLQQITRAQEEERKRIARELHDDTIQALVVHSQQIDDLTSSMERLPKHIIARLQELRQQANNMIQGLRRLSHDLRPAALDRLGLLPALRHLSSDVTEYAGIPIKVELLGAERRLPDEVKLVLFRIVQEALRNVWKHAQATKAEITAEFKPGKTRISVRDNGKGFSLPEKIGDLARDGKLGLAGMQERAQLLGGIITVESKFGKGTVITVELPTPFANDELTS